MGSKARILNVAVRGSAVILPKLPDGGSGKLCRAYNN